MHIYLETTCALLAEFFVISARELKTRYVPLPFYSYLTAPGKTSTFDVVKRVFPIELFSKSMTVFSY